MEEAAQLGASSAHLSRGCGLPVMKSKVSYTRCTKTPVAGVGAAHQRMLESGI